MARHPFQHPPAATGLAAATGDQATEIPPEHAITRLYVLPVGSAPDFMLEDDTEEPTPALRALLRGLAR
jgi:hypothetical protein